MNYEAEDKTGLYLVNERPVIKTVNPTEGKEGDIITIKGTGFSEYIRNNCIVVGGMGACARAQKGSTSTELKVRIDPVPRLSEGEILAWVGAGSDFYNETIGFRSSRLRFSETAIFRHGTPVAAAGISFKLTKCSKNAFGGEIVSASVNHANLGGHEKGNAIRVSFPTSLSIPKGSTVDICLILKEHATLAIDFTADIEDGSTEDCLRAIAKSIAINGAHIGEKVFVDVVHNQSKEDYELYVTKPYLEKGLMTVHFNMAKQ